MSIKNVIADLKYLLDHDTPAFVWGKPGVGKSDAIRQIVAERSWGLVDFRASTRDAVAVMGIPDTAGETTKWKVPDEFPQVERDGAEGILFLDELNAAPPSMQAAMFGLVLDRRVGDYVLPKGWRVVAAGNRQKDRAAAQSMPTALANRFAHLDAEPNPDDFVEWCWAHNKDPMLTAFIRFRPDLLHNMEGSDLRAFPSPRSLAQAEKYIHIPSRESRQRIIFSIIGEGAGAEFIAFIRLHESLPSLERVLTDPKNTPVPDDRAARYAIAGGLARKVDSKTFGNGVIYMERLPRELTALFVVDAVKRDNKISHTDAFAKWAVDNQDITIK
jgi:hypothetical protein